MQLAQWTLLLQFVKLHHGLRLKRQTSRQQFIRNHAQRPDIAGGFGLAAKLFGSHVRQGACDLRLFRARRSVRVVRADELRAGHGELVLGLRDLLPGVLLRVGGRGAADREERAHDGEREK